MLHFLIQKLFITLTLKTLYDFTEIIPTDKNYYLWLSFFFPPFILLQNTGSCKKRPSGFCINWRRHRHTHACACTYILWFFMDSPQKSDLLRPLRFISKVHWTYFKDQKIWVLNTFFFPLPRFQTRASIFL